MSPLVNQNLSCLLLEFVSALGANNGPYRIHRTSLPVVGPKHGTETLVRWRFPDEPLFAYVGWIKSAIVIAEVCGGHVVRVEVENFCEGRRYYRIALDLVVLDSFCVSRGMFNLVRIIRSAESWPARIQFTHISKCHVVVLQLFKNVGGRCFAWETEDFGGQVCIEVISEELECEMHS